MTRLKGQDNLDDLTGKLTAGFNAVTLKALQEQFVAKSPDAKKVLTDFYLAAEQLQKRENEFNKRAKPKAHDLKANLRSTEQLTAIRTFETAKQGLLGISPDLGERIANVVERNIATATKPTAKKSFAMKAPVPA
ncbi:MAG: hypothetical protein EPN97_11665 [Alphaproteobacteria bacterium]|nr:MAG: hypothetical protein EPN97_11665 [Alphaproteobacteria bacterium]